MQTLEVIDESMESQIVVTTISVITLDANILC